LECRIQPSAPAQPGIAADRFAREIVGFLKAFPERSRQLNANPFGGFQPLNARHASDVGPT